MVEHPEVETVVVAAVRAGEGKAWLGKKRSSTFVAETGRVVWAWGMEEISSTFVVEKSCSAVACGKEALELRSEEEKLSGTVAYALIR